MDLQPEGGHQTPTHPSLPARCGALTGKRIPFSDAEHHLLIALAHHGLGELTKARHHLTQTLAFTHTDQRAADLAHSLQGPRTGTV